MRPTNPLTVHILEFPRACRAALLFAASCSAAVCLSGTDAELQNDVLKVACKPLPQALQISVFHKTGQIAFPPVLLREELVFDEGSRVVISPGETAVPAAGEVAIASRLPANPLIGATPDGRSDLAFFRQDDTSKLTLTRAVSLAPGSAALTIRYRIANTLPTPVALCLFLGHSPDAAAVFQPTFDGVRLATRKQMDEAEYDAPDAWTAVATGDRCVLGRYDASAVSCILGSGVVTRRFTLNPGEVWETRVGLWFLRGLGRVDNVVSNIAAAWILPEPPAAESPGSSAGETDLQDASLEELMGRPESGGDLLPRLQKPDALGRRAFLPGKPIRLEIAAAGATAGAVTAVTAAAVHMDSGDRIALGDAALEPGRAGVALRRPLSFTPTAGGTWLLHAVYSGPGGLSVTSTVPVVVDLPSGIYIAAPAGSEPKAGAEFDRYRPERYSNPAHHDPFRADDPLTTTVSVPHAAYAQPLRGGPLRMAAFIPFWRARELVELMLRVETDMRPVLVGTRGYLMNARERALLDKGRPLRSAPRPPAFEARLMKKALAQPAEAILLAGLHWEWFPADIQAEILRQTRRGSTLVLCPPSQVSGELARAIGKTALTDYANPKKAPAVRRIACGAGRIVLFPASAEVTLSRPIFVDYFTPAMETNIEELCREIVTAAGRSAVDLAFSGSAGVAISNRTGAAFSGKLRLTIRTPLIENFPAVYTRSYYGASPFPCYETVMESDADLRLSAFGQETRPLALSDLPAGRHRITAAALDAEGRVAGWRSQDIPVDNGVTLTPPRIETPGGTEGHLLFRQARVKTSFSASDARGVAVGATAFLRCLDVEGRVVCEQTAPVTFRDGSATVSLEAPLTAALHRFLIVRVGLERAGRVLAETRAPLFIAPDRERDSPWEYILLGKEWYFPHTQYRMTCKSGGHAEFWPRLDMRYDAWPGIVASWQEAQDAVKDDEAAAPPPPALPRAGSETEGTEEAADVFAESPKKETPAFIRKPCFHDPENYRTVLNRCLAAVRETPRCETPHLMIVDEYLYGDKNACQCEHCRRAFALYLKDQFQTLDRLNREWGAQFRSWEEAPIYVIDRADTLPPRAQRAALVTTLRWKAAQMTRFVGRVAEEVLKTEPSADFGYSGCNKMSLWNGYDFYEMAQVGRRHTVYRDDWYWIGFTGPLGVRGWYHGYGRHYCPSQQAALPWSLLARDLPGTGAWIEYNYPFARMDGVLREGPRRFFEQMEIIRNGPAPLLLGRLARDPVAVAWSGPSFFVYGVEWWEGTQKRKTFRVDQSGGSVSDWVRKSSGIVRDSIESAGNLQPYCIGYGDLSRGGFGPFGKPKVLFLPYYIAMSPEAAETLRQFVKQGGILVGDVNTATHSEFGYTYPQPLLDDVFGIRRIGSFAGPTMLEKGDSNGNASALRLPGMNSPLAFNPIVTGGTNVQPAGATACGEWSAGGAKHPLFLVNRFGAGTAVYLNWVCLADNEITGARQGESAAQAQRAAIQWILNQAALLPDAWVESRSGERTEKESCTRFRDGNNLYVLANVPAGYPPEHYRTLNKTLVLNAPRHVYDSLRAAYAGRKDRMPIEWDGSRYYALYACLPYRVAGLRLSGPDSVTAGESAFFDAAVDAEGGPPGRHCFRVEVTRPDGMPAQVMDYVAEAPGGRARIELPMALNAPAGTWRVRAVDVATGAAQEKALTCRLRAGTP